MMTPFAPRDLPSREISPSEREASLNARREAEDSTATPAAFGELFASAVSRHAERDSEPRGGQREPKNRAALAQAASGGGAENSEKVAARLTAQPGLLDVASNLAMAGGLAPGGPTKPGEILKNTGGNANASRGGAGARGNGASLVAPDGTPPLTGNDRSTGLSEVAEGVRALRAGLAAAAPANRESLPGAAERHITTRAPLSEAALPHAESPANRLEALAPVRSPLPTRAETPPVWEQALQRAQTLAMGGGGSARLALRPEGLGHMELTVRVVHGRVIVTVLAESPEAASLLARESHRLGQGLAVQGFESAELDVRTGDPHQERRDRASAEELEAMEEGNQSSPAPRRARDLVPPTKRHRGLLDVVA